MYLVESMNRTALPHAYPSLLCRTLCPIDVLPAFSRHSRGGGTLAGVIVVVPTLVCVEVHVTVTAVAIRAVTVRLIDLRRVGCRTFPGTLRRPACLLSRHSPGLLRRCAADHGCRCKRVLDDGACAADATQRRLDIKFAVPWRSCSSTPSPSSGRTARKTARRTVYTRRGVSAVHGTASRRRWSSGCALPRLSGAPAFCRILPPLRT